MYVVGLYGCLSYVALCSEYKALETTKYARVYSNRKATNGASPVTIFFLVWEEGKEHTDSLSQDPTRENNLVSKPRLP